MKANIKQRERKDEILEKIEIGIILIFHGA